MDRKTNRENQRRFVAEKKAQGLKRLVLWAQPEDVESLRLAAHQPHALNRLRKKVERELRPKIEAEVAAELERKTRRAMLAQKRAQVRRQTAGSNRPPELIRFERRPPATMRNRVKAAGWLYDPVAAVWHLPDDPEAWPDVQRLLDEVDGYPLKSPIDKQQAWVICDHLQTFAVSRLSPSGKVIPRISQDDFNNIVERAFKGLPRPDH